MRGSGCDQVNNNLKNNKKSRHLLTRVIRARHFVKLHIYDLLSQQLYEVGIIILYLLYIFLNQGKLPDVICLLSAELGTNPFSMGSFLLGYIDLLSGWKDNFRIEKRK